MDELRALAREENVKSLPIIHVYQPGRGLLAAIEVPVSKLKNLRANLQVRARPAAAGAWPAQAADWRAWSAQAGLRRPAPTALPRPPPGPTSTCPPARLPTHPPAPLPASHSPPPTPQVIVANPGMDYATDPNGFVIALPRKAADVAAEEARRKAEAAALLNNSSAGLFEKLMASANGGAGAGAPPRYVPGTLDSQEEQEAPALERAAAGNGASSNGNGGGAAAPAAPVDPGLALAKSSFLMAHQRQYGYQGLIDKLYAREVGCRMQPGEHYMDYTGACWGLGLLGAGAGGLLLGAAAGGGWGAGAAGGCWGLLLRLGPTA